MANKNFKVSQEFKADLVDYVWRKRLPSMASVVQDVIRDYANGTLSVTTPPDVALEAEIKYLAPPEYPIALERARAEGIPLSAVIRFGLERRMTDQ